MKSLLFSCFVCTTSAVFTMQNKENLLDKLREQAAARAAYLRAQQENFSRDLSSKRSSYKSFAEQELEFIRLQIDYHESKKN